MTGAQEFHIDPRVFATLPGLRIGVVVAQGIDNTIALNLSDEFAAQKRRLLHHFEGVVLADYPVVRAWRQVYKSFGEKRNRSSVEALIRRTIGGKPVGSINALVDLYNLLSLTYEFPYGGEDLDALTTDIALTFATGDEEFVPLGGDGNVQHPKVGEIIYLSGKTVICGSFNYRESDLTKLTPATRNVALFIEDVAGTGHSDAQLREATEALASTITDHLGGTVRTAHLDEATPSCPL